MNMTAEYLNLSRGQKENNMRLIDADALVRKLEDKIINPQTALVNNVLIGLLKYAPTVDIKTEVAREIFEEIEDTFVNKVSKGIQERNQDWWLVVHIITKLKNKYTKEVKGENENV